MNCKCDGEVITRSSFATNYTSTFRKNEKPEMLSVYRRYLSKMRMNYDDESRQLLCLSKRK